MYGRIPADFIDQLIARVNIVDVIERRVPLTQKGSEYQACCPFHEEKTPSFTVSPAKQFYHCFGCGAHGTAVGFLMQYSNLSFPDAIEELASVVGWEVPRDNKYVAAKNNPKPLFDLVDEANTWFKKQLRSAAAKPAIEYLKQRGVDGAIAKEFGLGYAPNGWDNLARDLADDASKRSGFIKAGLIAARDNNSASADGSNIAENAGGVYDRFRHRIIFPIHDHRGRAVAFGGRALGDGEPKYLNSPETDIFHKGEELYGLHRARREIGKSAFSIVVEGYMDVVGLAQFGVHNAVATLGTATTRLHLKRLFQAAPEIVFCFDGDRAGRAAARKALQVAMAEMQDGRQIGFLFLPEGEDPDSIIRKDGKDGFLARVEKDIKPLPDFLFESLAAEIDTNSMDARARLITLAEPLLTQLPEGKFRDMMFERLDQRSGTSSLRRQHIKINTAPSKKMPKRPLPLPKFAISMLLQNPALAQTIDTDHITKITSTDGEVLQLLVEKIFQDANTTTARLLELFRDHEKTYTSMQELAARDNMIAATELTATFKDAIANLIKEQEKKQREKLITQLQQDLDPMRKRQVEQDLNELLKNRHAATACIE